MIIRLYMCLLIAAQLSGNVAAADEVALSNNPFARPSSAASTVSRSTSPNNGAPVVLQLQATLVSDAGRLANVDGNILRPSETIGGYTLVRVYEDKAIFTRDGRKITVYVKPDPASEDDEE